MCEDQFDPFGSWDNGYGTGFAHLSALLVVPVARDLLFRTSSLNENIARYVLIHSHPQKRPSCVGALCVLHTKCMIQNILWLKIELLNLRTWGGRVNR